MRKNRYVVGFMGREQRVVYGKKRGECKYELIESMTLLQARRELKELTGTPKAIFELVPCEVEQ